MIKFKNSTNLKWFREKVERGLFAFEKVSENEVIIKWNYYREHPYVYKLIKISDNIFSFSSQNYEYFEIIFKSNNDEIEIIKAHKNNKNYKADKFLKQFMQICILPSSFLLEFKLF